MTINDQEVLSMEEAAQFLGVTPYLIWEFARRWIIPGEIIDKKWQFKKADLLWLHKRHRDD
jgi:hypothetical protein